MTSPSSAAANPAFEQLLERFDVLIERNPDEALTLASEALPAAQTELERGRALMRLGWAERLMSKLPEARAHNDAALEIFERSTDMENHSLALTLAGAIEVYSGQREQAYRHLTRALEQSRATGHKPIEARACNALGVLFDWYGNHGAALEYLLRALQLLRETAQPLMEYMTLSNIGAIHYRQGEYEKALECYQQGVEGLQGLNAESNANYLRLNIGECLIKIGQAPAAQQLLGAMLEPMRAQRSVVGEGFVLRTIGTAHLAQGLATQALHSFEAALALAQRHNLFEEQGLAQLGVGQSQIALGRPNDALDALRLARAALVESATENQLEVLRAISAAAERIGDYRRALEVERQFSNLEREYRTENAERYTQSLMMGFELAQTQRQAAQALERNAELEAVLEEKERLATELERLSCSDALTGLHNRRSLDRHWAARLSPSADGSFVALLDIDAFKSVNNRFSHGVGDQVLRQIALLMRAQLQPSEIRWRGVRVDSAQPHADPSAPALRVAALGSQWF